MANKLYLLSVGPESGKAITSFGLLDLVRRQNKKVVFYRPFISDPETPGKKDGLLVRLLDHFKPGVKYDECYAYTVSEARSLINAGKGSDVFDTVIAKCRKLEAQYDFVLCIGSSLYSQTQMFEYLLNAHAAADLGAPSLVLLKGEGRGKNELVENARTFIREMRGCAVEVLGCMLNWSQLSVADSKAFAEALKTAPEDQATPNVYVMPENANANGSAENAINYVSNYLDGRGLIKAVADYKVSVVTPKFFEADLMERAKKHKMRIVLPEGVDDRVLKAAANVEGRGVADLIVLGDEQAVKKRLMELGLSFKGKIINPQSSPKFEEYAAAYSEARKTKGVTIEQAREVMKDATYFGTMMVWKDDADGMVSGAINTTAHTIRPAFEFVKMKPGVSIVSSIFLVCLKDRVLAYGDCAVNPNPTAEQLASIAVTSARTAAVFGVEPRVAMASYSTGTSGKGPDVDLVIEATKLAKEMAPDLPIEGPIQYDAAIDPDVAKTKLPYSDVAGKATVFIFPDLNTGNNTYKAVQRSAGAVAIGPILQGLNKPVNDLSRGCLVADIINTIAITAVQAQADKGLI